MTREQHIALESRLSALSSSKDRKLAELMGEAMADSAAEIAGWGAWRNIPKSEQDVWRLVAWAGIQKARALK